MKQLRGELRKLEGQLNAGLAAPARPAHRAGNADRDRGGGGKEIKKIEAIPIDPIFKDKEPCRKHLAGICPLDARDCKHKHYTWPPDKTMVCTWFSSKNKGCTKGDNCPCAHIAVGQAALDFLLNKKAATRSPTPKGDRKGGDKGKGKGKDKGKGEGKKEKGGRRG